MVLGKNNHAIRLDATIRNKEFKIFIPNCGIYQYKKIEWYII